MTRAAAGFAGFLMLITPLISFICGLLYSRMEIFWVMPLFLFVGNWFLAIVGSLTLLKVTEKESS